LSAAKLKTWNEAASNVDAEKNSHERYVAYSALSRETISSDSGNASTSNWQIAPDSQCGTSSMTAQGTRPNGCRPR
jgi:hypothetical protein